MNPRVPLNALEAYPGRILGPQLEPCFREHRKYLWLERSHPSLSIHLSPVNTDFITLGGVASSLPFWILLLQVSFSSAEDFEKINTEFKVNLGKWCSEVQWCLVLERNKYPCPLLCKWHSKPTKGLAQSSSKSSRPCCPVILGVVGSKVLGNSGPRKCSDSECPTQTSYSKGILVLTLL